MIDSGRDAQTRTFWWRCTDHGIEKTWIGSLVELHEAIRVHREVSHAR